MEIIQGIFDLGMPHIPHKVREHGVYVLLLPQPAVHVGIDKVMSEIICTDADARILLFRESGIPETQEVPFQPAGTVWTAFPVWEKERAVREQAADPAVIASQIFRKFLGNIDSPALGPLGLEDIEITLIQMYVLPGKCACLFTAEPTAVHKPEDRGEDQMPSL